MTDNKNVSTLAVAATQPVTHLNSQPVARRRLTNKYTYTIAGRLFTEDGPFANDTVTNFYFNGLRTNLSLAQPTGSWTNGFGYDAAKRLTSVTRPARLSGVAARRQRAVD